MTPLQSQTEEQRTLAVRGQNGKGKKKKVLNNRVDLLTRYLAAYVSGLRSLFSLAVAIVLCVFGCG
jgi:hypothetical protein